MRRELIKEWAEKSTGKSVTENFHLNLMKKKRKKVAQKCTNIQNKE